MSLTKSLVESREVPLTEAGAKLDAVVARLFPSLSRKRARQAILRGEVRLNGKTVKIFARSVRAGDVISLAASDAPQPSPRAALTILFQDASLVVVDKPAHLLSERIAGEKGDDVLAVLRRKGVADGRLVHRLDAGTSGVLIVARGERAAHRLTDAFKRGEVEKSYLLLCLGAPGDGEFADRLGRDPNHPRRFAFRADGKLAVTRFRTLSVGRGVSLVSARPVTGRTHQIRVHFQGHGFPLLGDALYKGPSRLDHDGRTMLFARPLLHAFAVEFPHPVTGRRRSFRVPPPEDFVTAARASGITEATLLFDGWDPLW